MCIVYAIIGSPFYSAAVYANLAQKRSENIYRKYFDPKI